MYSATSNINLTDTEDTKINGFDASDSKKKSSPKFNRDEFEEGPQKEQEHCTKCLSDYDYLRITAEKYIPKPLPTITIANAVFAKPCNISGISAAAKAGKTAVKNQTIASALTEDGYIKDFEAIKVIPNSSGKAIIDFDTEQSEEDHQDNLIAVLKRSGINKTPDFYRSYNIRQLSIDDYQTVTTDICELCNEQFNGIHSIYIDGAADFITSVNDEASATNIIKYFTQLSIKYNCPVIVIVHLNPGSDKERGHIGSELQRRCYGLITIVKEGDISTIQPKIMRKASNTDMPLIQFTYSKEFGYHVQIEAKSADENKAKQNRERLEQIAKEVFAPPAALAHKDAYSKIMQVTNKGKTTAKNMLEDMEGFGYVVKHEDGLYRIKIKVNEGQNRSN